MADRNRPPTDAFDPSGIATERHWRRIGTRRRLGVAVPLFSLRSERSVGMGDVADLERLVDWCGAIDASVIQLLPLNDMGPDSAPYGAISAFANDPLYIALDRLPEVEMDDGLRADVTALRASLEASPQVDYARVRRERGRILEAAFERRRPALQRDRIFIDWVADNRHWLEDYAIYRAIREARGWQSWEQWGAEFEDDAALLRFATENADRIQFHRWHQFEIDRQLHAARRYASERGVLLKGDIPILIGRDSADVWRNPEFFRLDTVAGAPPDYFSEDGQYWGFPTYDWETLWARDCRWWRDRLSYAARFFDLYRIDHVVGLFRIWTIRHGEETGRNGWFVPENEAEWGAHGRRILEMMLDETEMLPIAEDLGTIPDVCRATLADMGICGTKVIRWERRWHEHGQPFIPPETFPPVSMTTQSVHDSETLRGWWEAYPDQRQTYWEALGHQGEAPPTMSKELHEQALRSAVDAGSVFSILAIQDILAPYGLVHDDAAANRINVPGTVSERNWSWRLPVTLERLIEDDGLNAHLRSLLARP